MPTDAQSSHARTRTPPAECTAVIGLQWGDEGKGKAVDLLAKDHDAVVRYNGGANAGHSLVVNGTRFSVHLIPSGILYPCKLSVIANGVVVDPEKLLGEIDAFAVKGIDTSGLILSDRAHVVAPYHKAEDEMREELLRATASPAPGGTSSDGEIGTTKRGIGPAYADKVQRSTAIRAGDLLREDVLRQKLRMACAFKNDALAGMARVAGKPFTPFDPGALAVTMLEQGRRLAPMIKDTTYLLHGLLAQGKRILFEGANATLLDVDHGTYPFVTSSSCGVHGIGPGTGVPERRISTVLGVMKAYSTRVGRGPLPTELHDETGERIRQRGREFGTTTGRPRRVGWLDLVAVRYSAMINGATGLVLTLLDVLDGVPELKVCTAYRIGGKTTDQLTPDGHTLLRAEPVYKSLPGFKGDLSTCRRREDLPDAARKYVDFIEDFVGVPVALIGVGPGREQTIVCDR
jgi:adenylosuccinate synthase